MIKQIQEINFPSYATLSSATVTLNDMGDKTITAQVKIDGGVAPDFSYDWEVEFKGERYIQPLREPQASKGNESICSVIDLTFYHKTIYDLKRYYFPKMAEVQSGTVSVDKYIADLNLNLEGFCDALQQVLDYYLEIGYFNERITINLKGKGAGIYAQEPQYVQIQYTHIWDVVQKIYDLFGVRWSIEGREIKIGYPTEEVAHTFEYGFEGGLLKVERQVQSADIRNSLLGRGGSKNLPYRYFKETDPQNPSFLADPDAIPELANIYFTELRGKTFRDYVKGWKAKHYGGTPMSEPTEAYTKGYTDTTFNPIEYVEDKDSIAKYGLLQGGLENQEDIYPSIQGVEVDGLGRVDEIVGAEQVTVDESEDNSVNTIEVSNIVAKTSLVNRNIGTYTYKISNLSISVPDGYVALASYDFDIKIEYVFGMNENPQRIDTLPADVNMKIWVETKLNKTSNYFNSGSHTFEYKVSIHRETSDYHSQWYGAYVTVTPPKELKLIYGEVLSISKTSSIKVEGGNTNRISVKSDPFQIKEGGATQLDIPVNITTDDIGIGQFTWKKDVTVVNVNTGETLSSINIPQGNYTCEIIADISNLSDTDANFELSVGDSVILYPTDSEEFKPTFYIYVKNIWNTTRNEGESNEAYTNRVWTPILVDREGNKAKVVFSTGWLAGHSDYEFVINDVEYAGDKGVQSEDGIPAEWKITLIKSDAEIEATGKWIPSTTQQANAGDKFFFIGVDMPHEYTLWAEQAVDNFKADQLLETAHIKPTWVVLSDKVRLNQLQPNETEPLLNALKVGNSIRLADTRFTNGIAQTLYLQSVTYTWDAQTSMYPNVEVVLSDKVVTTTNPVAQLQGEVDALTKQVGSLSNIQQIVRAVGDKAYLRKDGIADTSNSETTFNKSIHSHRFQQGAIGGRGWGLREENGKSIIEADTIIARNELQVNSLVANQVVAVGGKQILSAANITCSRVETTEQGFKCYFDQKRGSVANLFQVNDIAYSQVFNPNNNEVKYYKREVIAISDNSITLSLEGNGDGMPQEGDVIVQYGNTTNADRQYVIIRDVIGGGYERMLSDLNSVNTKGTEYYFAGRIEGGTPRWFVGNKSQQFIEYKDGHLQINADVTLGSGSDLSASEEFQDVKQTANQAKQDAQNAEASAKSYADELVKDLQNQLDGKVESFFYDYDPTLDNLPASEWTTNELKAEHLNDTFTNTESGRSWRWLFKDDSYQWVEIADTQSAEALAKAQEALGVANGKVAVFVTEPRSPYNAKDLWLQGEDGRIKRCTITRTTTGEFYAEDWVNADDSHEYTDEKISSYKATVDATVESLNNAIADAEANANAYTNEGKAALQASIAELNNAKANINEVYTKAEADGKIDQAEADAITAAQELANAARAFAEETAKAYADGVVDAEEEARIKQAQENLNEAKEYAEGKAKEAEDNAKEYADTQISSYDLTIKYLKDAFNQGSVLDVNGVTLSALVGVKDENGAVVAGLYGGASDILNSAGYADSIHGAMLLFGGIEGVDKPTTHKTAVFEDGFLQSTYFATAKEGKRVEIFGNELKVYGDDANNSVLSISYDSTGKPRLQYTDKYGNVSWYLSNVGISTSYTVKQIDDLLLGYVKLNTPQGIEAKHTFINGLKIGDAVLSWDSENGGLKVSHADGTTAVGLYATGYITAGGIGSSSGGTGGGGSSTLAGLNDVALKSAIADDMLVYNGTHWVNTPMSAIKPDLTDYATKSWVEAKGYITASALTPYALKTDIPSLVGYATEDFVNNKLQNYTTTEDLVENYASKSDLESAINDIDLSAYLLKADLTKSRIQSTLGISDWALAATKPSYAWSEITSRPTALSQFTDDVVAGKYLPITGGIINTAATTPLNIKNTQSNPTEVGIRFLFNDDAKGWIGYNTQSGTHLYTYNGAHKLGVKDDGTAYLDSNTLIHSGNIGNYKSGDSAKLGGYDISSFLLTTKRDYTTMDLNTIGDKQSIFTEIRTGEVTTLNCPISGYGALLSLKDGNSYAKMQIVSASVSADTYIRCVQSSGSTISANWQRIITDNNIGNYNAGSATKLQTRHTLWGQSFDGTDNVSGDINNAAGGIYIHNTNEINSFNGKLYINNHGSGLAGYGSTNDIVMVANGGNVSIGKVYAGSTAKLQIDTTATTNWAGVAEFLSDSLTDTHIQIGRSLSTKNSAFLAYHHTSANSNLNYTGIGFYGGGYLVKIFADGSIEIGGVKITASNGSITVNGNVLATGAITARA